MRKEIERKFIVNGDAYKSLAKGVLYRQGYIPLTCEVENVCGVGNDHLG